MKHKSQRVDLPTGCDCESASSKASLPAPGDRHRVAHQGRTYSASSHKNPTHRRSRISEAETQLDSPERSRRSRDHAVDTEKTNKVKEMAVVEITGEATNSLEKKRLAEAR